MSFVLFISIDEWTASAAVFHHFHHNSIYHLIRISQHWHEFCNQIWNSRFVWLHNKRRIISVDGDRKLKVHMFQWWYSNQEIGVCFVNISCIAEDLHLEFNFKRMFRWCFAGTTEGIPLFSKYVLSFAYLWASVVCVSNNNGLVPLLNRWRC